MKWEGQRNVGIPNNPRGGSVVWYNEDGTVVVVVVVENVETRVGRVQLRLRPWRKGKVVAGVPTLVVSRARDIHPREWRDECRNHVDCIL
jgi:hypothetical protein